MDEHVFQRVMPSVAAVLVIGATVDAHFIDSSASRIRKFILCFALSVPIRKDAGAYQALFFLGGRMFTGWHAPYICSGPFA